jgi:glutaryl-CoA dehydrogenase
MTYQHPDTLLDLFRDLSPEQREIKSVVQEFTRAELQPHIAHWFENDTLPARELAQNMGALGLFGMHLEGYGCAGTDATSYGLACLELEACDSGLRSFVSVQGSLAMYAIHEFGSEDQKLEYLPRMATGELLGCFGLTESDFGSNPAGMRTHARRDGQDWILTGTKYWITNGTIADIAIVWAQTDEGIRGFVVPRDSPGFRAIAIKRKMSLKASVTAELVLDNVRLPQSALLAKTAGLKSALQCLNEARFGIVFGAMGAARDCLETALEYSQMRVQFDRPISGFQLTQAKLSEMAVHYQTGVLLALHLGKLKDAGGITPHQVSIGKFNNVSAALNIARTARSILGGSGITLDYPVMRHMANLESVVTYEGTHEIHTLAIGQALTGISAFKN